MKYIIIEIQLNADGSVDNLLTAYDTHNATESCYEHTGA